MSDLINGLRHMADDHPCCRETLQLTIDTIEKLERENAKLREALEISDDYINQMLHGDIELTHGQLESWRKVIYRLRTKEDKP